MKLKITSPNIKRLASLSALGAGALGATAGTAQASTIVFSGILDQKVGFSPSSNKSVSFVGPNGVAALMERYSRMLSKHSFEDGVAIAGQHGPQGSQLRFLAGFHSGTFAWGLPSGAKFGTAKCAGSPCFPSSDAWVALRSAGPAGPFHFKAFNATAPYLLFEFGGGSLPQTLFGWAQLDVSFNSQGNPAVTLVDWAYDTSGAAISAGDTGQSSTPEPSTLALTGLAALALGAKGLRAWRASRKAA